MKLASTELGAHKIMNGFIKAEEIAERWNVSARQVQALCKEGLVDGAIKFGNSWAIPEDAEKPTRTGKLKPGRKPKVNNNKN